MHPIHRLRQHQRGATLLIALIFLVILTLFAVSGMNTGIINLRTANNSQLILEAEYAAQQQVEAVLNNRANFQFAVTPPPTVTNVDVNGDSVTDFVVTTQPAICLSIKQATGFEYGFIGTPNDTVWQVTASAADSVFGASATLRQGVKVRLDAAYECRNPA